MATSAPNPYEPPLAAEMAGSPLTISPSGELEYSFVVTEDDWLALSEHVMKTLPHYRFQFMLVRLAGAVLVIMGAAALWYEKPVFFLPLLIGLIFLFMPEKAWRWRSLRATRKVIRTGQNRTVLGPHRIQIKAREVVNFHDFGYSAVYWPAVERVETTQQYLFIFVGVMSAHIVPLRDLRTPHDRTTLIETVTRYFQESRAGVPAARGA